GLHPHTETGEQARSDADGDAADVLELDAGPLEEALDGREQVVVPADAGEACRAEDLLFGPERDRCLLGRGVDTQDDHGASPPGTITRPRPPPGRASTARVAARDVPIAGATSGPRPVPRSSAHRPDRRSRARPQGARPAGVPRRPAPPRRAARRLRPT